jgi:hypothetical protein
MGRVFLLFSTLLLLISLKAASQQHLPAVSDSTRRGLSLLVLPQNFYNQHLSFFCKKEVQLQRLTSFPVYFRLGLKDYVDYLEKKPNARSYRQ